MVFEEFEFPGLEEGNGVWELEVCCGVWRGRGEFLPAGGADDVEAHQIRSDRATGGASGAIVEENFGHAVG